MLDHESIQYLDFYDIHHGEKPKQYIIEEYRAGKGEGLRLRLVDPMTCEGDLHSSWVMVTEDVPNRSQRNTFPGRGNDIFWMNHNNEIIERKVAASILRNADFYSKKTYRWARENVAEGIGDAQDLS